MTKEEISARQQQAAQFHAMGYNCAQSVACAFADKVIWTRWRCLR